MPIFKWNAIDLNGNTSQGVDFSISKTELTHLLQYRHLGLMHCRQLRKDFYNHKIKIWQQLNFFHNLNALLLSGMPLPQALQILLNQSKNIPLRCVIGYVLYQVQEQGVNFGEALQKFSNVLGPLVVVVLKSGFNVGKLPEALSHICSYLENKLQMQRELRRAILMPILTLALFVIVAALVFLVVVPQFAIIFENAKIPLDNTTQIVLNLAIFFQSRQALIWLLVVFLTGFIINLFTKTRVGKQIWHRILLFLPLIGTLIQYRNLFSFLQSAALLIDGGVPVTEAFGVSVFSINNVILRKQTMQMIKLVEHGTSIQIAMRQAAPKFFTKDAIAMIAVGEESGCLGKMLGRTAEVYQQRYRQRLQLILSLVQPTLVISLGLLVALLIFAIYMPIFNMPAVIG
jgi:type II secretory pathway component PulF